MNYSLDHLQLKPRIVHTSVAKYCALFEAPKALFTICSKSNVIAIKELLSDTGNGRGNDLHNASVGSHFLFD